MKVFITGGTGFIGRHAVEALLEHGFTVLMLIRDRKTEYPVHKNLHVIQGNLSRLDAIAEEVKAFRPGAVIHLAWEGLPDYSFDVCEKNLLYGHMLLKFCSDTCCRRLIVTGSCWEYETKQGMVSEKDPLSTTNAFRASKNAFRSLAEVFCKDNNISFHWLRLFYVYGPGQKAESLIPHIIYSVKKGEQPYLTGAHNENDFVYVKDVAEAIVEVLKKEPLQSVLNIGAGKAVKVLDVLKLIAKEMGFSVNESIYEKSINSSCFWADINRITTLTDWNPRYEISDGIKEMLKYNKCI